VQAVTQTQPPSGDFDTCVWVANSKMPRKSAIRHPHVRNRNAALLRNVLAQKHLTERDDTVSTRRRDVERLLDILPDSGRTGFLAEY
jgi:hypothetical protein